MSFVFSPELCCGVQIAPLNWNGPFDGEFILFYYPFNEFAILIFSFLRGFGVLGRGRENVAKHVAQMSGF